MGKKKGPIRGHVAGKPHKTNSKRGKTISKAKYVAIVFKKRPI